MNTNKIWLVTGASRGLGLEIIKTLLNKGYKVAATARNPKSIINALGEQDNLLALKLDVTSQQEAYEAVAKTSEHFGKIDVLVNNAGYGQLDWFENNSDAQIRQQFETKYLG